MATPIQVKSLDHVTIVVKDLERSRQFYVDGLGMRETPRPAFTFLGSWFQAGATQIHLIQEHVGTPPAGNPLADQSSHRFVLGRSSLSTGRRNPSDAPIPVRVKETVR